MRVVVKHLQRDKKSGLLSYRRRFPKELVALIPSKSPNGRGRTELKDSLGASSINDPAALARYAEAEQKFAAIVAKARRVATKAYDKLDEALVRYLAETYVHDQVESDEAMRWGRDHRPARYATTCALSLGELSNWRFRCAAIQVQGVPLSCRLVPPLAFRTHVSYG